MYIVDTVQREVLEGSDWACQKIVQVKMIELSHPPNCAGELSPSTLYAHAMIPAITMVIALRACVVGER